MFTDQNRKSRIQEKGKGGASASLKRISTFVDLLFTLWPPGPVAREKDISSLSLGIGGTRLYRMAGFWSA